MYKCSVLFLQEQVKKQRDKNCSLLARVFESISELTFRTTWPEVGVASCVCGHLGVASVGVACGRCNTWTLSTVVYRVGLGF